MKEEINPCRACGSTEQEIRLDETEDDTETSQYLRVYCKRGAMGAPSYYFKHCGLDGLSDREIAIIYWNDVNKTKAGEK